MIGSGLASRGLGLKGDETGERAGELPVEGDFIAKKKLGGTGVFVTGRLRGSGGCAADSSSRTTVRASSP